MVITKRMIIEARIAGACSKSEDNYTAGAPVESISWDDFIWLSNAGLDDVLGVEHGWTLAGSGYGGDGYGGYGNDDGGGYGNGGYGYGGDGNDGGDGYGNGGYGYGGYGGDGYGYGGYGNDDGGYIETDRTGQDIKLLRPCE